MTSRKATDIHNIIFIDIETVREKNELSELSEKMQSAWTRRAKRLTDDPNPDVAELYKTRSALYAEFGKVIVIAMGVIHEVDGEPSLRMKCLSGHDEVALLNEFRQTLEGFDQSRYVFCAHNGREFDFPYLGRRMVINHIAPPAMLDLSGRPPWELNHIDTMELWAFGARKPFISQDFLCTLLNVPTSKSDINGSMVGSVYYDDNDLERIASYCYKDVVTLVNLYRRMKVMPLIDEKNIERA